MNAGFDVQDGIEGEAKAGGRWSAFVQVIPKELSGEGWD